MPKLGTHNHQAVGHVRAVSGWAVVDQMGINVKTVSDTRRAAIINWLCVAKGRIIVSAAAEEDIEAMWQEARGREADVTTVRIVAP